MQPKMVDPVYIRHTSTLFSTRNLNGRQLAFGTGLIPVDKKSSKRISGVLGMLVFCYLGDHVRDRGLRCFLTGETSIEDMDGVCILIRDTDGTESRLERAPFFWDSSHEPKGSVWNGVSQRWTSGRNFPRS